MKIGCRDDIRFFCYVVLPVLYFLFGYPQEYICTLSQYDKQTFLFCSALDLHYLCNMKKDFNWKKVLLFAIVAGALLIITDSFLMSLGIVLLLFIGDHFAQELDKKRKGEKE